ncbi:hypothetical protein SSBR45G_53820 [Bradyrhizobium sp. SSBR45G]|uniref:hypothetical protein n=1 Tax=unclassified Bradyrhizobium TaxID=2631580 RepID=UPI002342BB5D|nr:MULTISPECIES: hypothetical protein [unclassified Bradyrhizobium]GLH80473.1 hypothetical protein SSBR45G_53820 [Bradyrhizobium sp. SSBR45G]GLH87868.1 hypothetical protein SSBR45R_53280 [Bradyrhizobium sp. SSBR45R]
MRVAFALAGLGGLNAHGAGFLDTARAWGVTPDLVTATSGQILVLSAWLQGRDLRDQLISSDRVTDPASQLRTLLLGYPGVFRPAYAESLARFAAWPDWRDGPFNVLADRLLPAQQYVPVRSEADFMQAAETLNGTTIGVVFNTYDPEAGTGYMYGNDAARALLPSEKSVRNDHGTKARQSAAKRDLRYASDVQAERTIHPITPEAIKAALWLSLYGFSKLPDGQMDGAYHRASIISELHGFDRIFAVRPLANGWQGKAPQNWFEVQDWTTEMWFSVGYKAEVDALKRINDLIAAGVITDPKYRHVDLVEIQPETPAGYFNYFVERGEVYENAVAATELKFKELKLVKPRT